MEKKDESRTPASSDKRVPLVQSLIRAAFGFLFIGAVFFLPAGSLRYWQAWVYLGMLFVLLMGYVGYAAATDPEMLRQRLKTGERQTNQKIIVAVLALSLTALFVLPGFDFRFAWSRVPVWLVVVADVLAAAGFGLFALVMRANRFGSRVIEVADGQTVVSSGPYAFVRHPMYSSMILFTGATPLALGSYWALIPWAGFALALVARLANEERYLAKSLPGYGDYMKKVRFRLVPGLF